MSTYQKGNATRWLEEFLRARGGSASGIDIARAARAARYPRSTVRHARGELGLDNRKVNHETWWMLP